MLKPHRVGLACAALVLLSTVCYLVLQSPYGVWDGARLMPSFALAKGVNYYVLLPRGGPLFTTVYGPMAAIVYLPATLFRTPNSAILAGSVITVVLCFSAVAFLHFAPLKRERSAVDGLAFLTVGFLICFLPPLTYSCFSIHADGPGLAFGAVACGALYAGEAKKWRIALLVSALCAVLSVFSKQTFLPVPITLLAWVLAVEGRKVAGRYLLCLVAAGVIATAASMAAWGPEPLYHCLIWVPAHHPWRGGSGIETWIWSAREFIELSYPVLILLLAGAIYFALSGRIHDERWRTVLANRCVPPLLVGIAEIPFSILGNAKSGGDVNSFSFALFFLTCGVTMMLADLWYGAKAVQTRHLAISVLLATMLPLAAYEVSVAHHIRSEVRNLPQTEQQLAFAYLKEHPGKAYFPWFPLAHLYAEGQFRHFIWGLADRFMAGETVSMTEFRSYVPPDAEEIVFAESDDQAGPRVFGFDLMKFLPEYSRSVDDPELHGWLAYAKKTPQ
jgi:hypothetical protein